MPINQLPLPDITGNSRINQGSLFSGIMRAVSESEVRRKSSLVYEESYCGRLWELVNPELTATKKLSVALVEVRPGEAALPHRHQRTEEVYFIIAGKGRIEAGQVSTDVGVGDTVYIAPGDLHRIVNPGSKLIRLLAINSPPYSPTDTFAPDGQPMENATDHT